MLTVSDLIHLPYPSGLTEAGIAYACRLLACTNDPQEVSTLDHLRFIVSQVALELAFRRYLGDQNIHFDNINEASFTHPDLYNIALGGHRCIIKSFLISRRSQISQIRRNPGLFLQAPALLPDDKFAVEGYRPDDLYLFTYLLGLVAASQENMDKARSAGQPVYLIHLLPKTWAKPANWVPLGKLPLKSECELPITVEIGGQDGERAFITSTLILPPRQRMLVENDFHSLAYLHAQRRPEARIGIHSMGHGEPYIIPAHAWSNLWVYGLEILLAGWLTHEEFRHKARVLNAGAHTFQHDHTHLKHLFVPCEQLNPLEPLFQRVRDWNKVGIPSGG
jgi:hypothetical protein